MKKLKEEMEGVVKELAENNHILERWVIKKSFFLVIMQLSAYIYIYTCICLSSCINRLSSEKGVLSQKP